MKSISKIQLNNRESIDISNMLELALHNYGYSRERIIHYTFLVEETLLMWRKELPGESELTIIRKQTGKDIIFTFSVEGKKANPFIVQWDDSDDYHMDRMEDRLLSGVGCELKYRYRRISSKGTWQNEILLKLPRKDVENSLFRRTLVALMIPLSLGVLIQNVSVCIDTLMLGFVDDISMGAASLASNFNTLHFMIITAVTIGETILISQYWGRRERACIKVSLRLSMLAGMGISLIFFLSGILFAEEIMRFYTQSPELIEEGAKYLRFISVSYLIIPFNMVYCGMMRTMGAEKAALLFTLAGCILNIIFNSIMIFGLFGVEPMGVAGAGIATVLSSFFQFACVIIYRIRHRLQLRTNGTRVDRETLKQIVSVFFSKSIPVLMQYIVYLIGSNTIASAFGHMSPDIVAANAIIITVSTMFISIATGIGMSTGVIIGAHLGKNEFDKAWNGSRIAIKTAAEFGIVVIAAFVLSIIIIINSSMDLSQDAVFYLGPLTVACCINSFFGFINATTNNGCLYAGGDTMAVLAIDGLVMGIVMIPVSLLVIFTDILPVIPAIMLLRMDEVFTCPFKYLRANRKYWLRNITYLEK